ncbi:hypothetical protein Peur_053722 [Populus x canadensis]
MLPTGTYSHSGLWVNTVSMCYCLRKTLRLRLVGVEVMSKEQEHGILEINFRNKMPSKIFKRFSESK